MDTSITVAIVAASGAVLTSAGTTVLGIFAILANNKRFDDIRKRIDDVGSRIDRIDHTLDVIQADLKQFYRDIVRLKEKTGLD